MSFASEAIVLRQPGGPEALVLESVTVPAPGPGQILVRQSAASVNFHDIYVRSGAYQTLPLPGIPGLEAVGRVEAVGEGVDDFAPGDRIAYIDTRYGGYARLRVLDATLAVPLPEGIDDGVATAWYLKGLTAQALVDDVEPVHAGSVVLAQAAGGGVGQLVARLSKLRGATVIGTAGSPEKAAIARAAGCDHVIAYREEDVAARVMDLTGGRGVDVSFDAVGKDTFEGSLASLAMKGHLVHYGQASGPIPPFDLSRLGPKSAKVSRPFLWPYIRPREKLLSASASLFAAMAAGDLPLTLGGRFPLADAAGAHAALEARAAGPFVLDC
ncbi:Alcohol dehydrogenase zinc-binding domain protein [Novosphingobium nitrogenifigens DSM 19370]|uniref:Alcohol dehydrogenase zinc-binding domain protein n=1 Tax=Novosphingobium nitrogenifigens DSM 19370 TaxID=983920 RepID=F1Z5W4_9SPHN|nr:quinone oxidoreductase [Novosphingobium nitrogenifigens]EGD60224.1 Alcohol dehydrogenase zinc-binding domain protein [Novosphingobium nitrogenifigens DSM 19370]